MPNAINMLTAAALKGMSAAQKSMVLASDPDDITGEEGVGVELRRGADYAVAKCLEALGLGHRTGPGGSLPGMYWNNARGLSARSALLLSLEEI